jgi:hypothetical protein
MATAASPIAPSFERGPRRSLFWGGGLMVLGLALVGVGAPDEGAVISLLGLFLTIYGIHTFGRLGEEGAPPDEASLARARASDQMWRGGLAFLAGAAVTASGYVAASGGGSAVLAYGAILGGAIQFFRGLAARGQVRKPQAKVEKRRRLDKSPRP